MHQLIFLRGILAARAACSIVCCLLSLACTVTAGAQEQSAPAAATPAPAAASSASDQAFQIATPTAPQTAVTAQSAFGYDSFRPGTEKISDGPIDEMYVLSPGDEVIVSIWGQLVQKFNLVVTDEGFIDLPDDGGRIATSGVTLKELRPVVMQALSQIYSSYINAADPTKSTAFVDIRLGKVRPLLVYVLGEVQKPGAYLISAGMANVLNVLNNAEGVRNGGSLREVKVRRSNGDTEIVDLYQFFLTGKLDLNAVRLKPNDYIIVPLKSRTVSIEGEVRRATRFELIGSEGMRELIDFAGGFTPDAYPRQVQIIRNEPGKGESVIDVDVTNIMDLTTPNIALQDGDTVRVPTNVQVRRKVVSVRGDGVVRPGTYEWQPNMTMRDLIDKAEGLREYAFTDRADLIRTEDDFSKSLTIFSLAELFQKDAAGKFAFTGNNDKNMPLREMDEVFVQSSFGLAGQDKFVTLEGHVKQPGKTVLAKNMTLYDLIFVRGGFQDPAFERAAYKDVAHIIRKVPGSIGEQLIPFRLGALLQGDPSANMQLQDSDVIRLYSYEDLAMRRTVQIDGLVKKPGIYPMVEGLTLEDLLVLAGGLRPDAYKVEAVVARVEADTKAQSDASRTYPTFVVPIPPDYVNRRDDQRVPLRPFDRISVRNVLGWEPLDVVSITGEVLYPGNYSLAAKDETMSSLIKKAGGLRKEGLPEGATVRRRRSVLTLDTTASPVMYEITIDLASALAAPGGSDDIVLKNGDEIHVPTNPGTIEVRGAVRRPLVLQFKEGQALENYVAKCGGYLDKADRTRVLVFAANNVARTIDADSDDPDSPMRLSAGSVIEVPLIKDSEWLQTVDVSGAVMKPARLQWVEDAQLGFYLNMCGGFSTTADPAKIIIHLPDGGILAKQEGEAFNPKVPPGSTVVIMTKPQVEAK
jgi:protein involved in polysaccharide export with SLBB domain